MGDLHIPLLVLTLIFVVTASVALWAIRLAEATGKENAAFRRIMADQLRRGGCPDDLIDEAIDKAVRDA